MRLSRILIVLGATTVGLVCSLAPRCLSARELPPQKASVSIDWAKPGRRVHAGLFGSNLQWEHAGDGALRGDSWAPGLLKATREANIRTLRFPGGSLANTYRWRSAVGPRRERKQGKSFGGEPVPSIFGSDEFARLCQQTHSQGIVTTNVSAGPQEAAEWVEYLNGEAGTPLGDLRTQHGIREPLEVEYWEVGNELYSPDEQGHVSASAYGHKVRAFSKAMKARDPSIKVGAHLEVSFLQAAWMKRAMPHMASWNENVLKVSGRDIDFVTVHFYAPFDTTSSEDRLHRLVWAAPKVLAKNLAMLRKLLRRYARPDVEIALTEYGTFFGEKAAPDPRIASTENALFTALLLMRCMREPGVTLANHWSLINNSSFGMLRTDEGGRCAPRPTYDAFRGMAAMAEGALLPTQVTGPSYSVEAKGNVPALASVSTLNAVAVRTSGGDLKAAFVNRSAERPVRVRVRIKGSRVPREVFAKVLSPANARGTAWKNAPPVRLSRDKRGAFDLTLPAQSLAFVESARRGQR